MLASEGARLCLRDRDGGAEAGHDLPDGERQHRVAAGLHCVLERDRVRHDVVEQDSRVNVVVVLVTSHNLPHQAQQTEGRHVGQQDDRGLDDTSYLNNILTDPDPDEIELAFTYLDYRIGKVVVVGN